MDDNIDDEAAVATYMLRRIMREKRKWRRTVWVLPRMMQMFASICYYISKYKIIYAFKLRCRHCVEYNTHWAV